MLNAKNLVPITNENVLCRFSLVIGITPLDESLAFSKKENTLCFGGCFFCYIALKSAGFSSRRPKCHAIASAIRVQALPSP